MSFFSFQYLFIFLYTCPAVCVCEHISAVSQQKCGYSQLCVSLTSRDSYHNLNDSYQKQVRIKCLWTKFHFLNRVPSDEGFQPQTQNFPVAVVKDSVKQHFARFQGLNCGTTILRTSPLRISKAWRSFLTLQHKPTAAMPTKVCFTNQEWKCPFKSWTHYFSFAVN